MVISQCPTLNTATVVEWFKVNQSILTALNGTRKAIKNNQPSHALLSLHNVPSKTFWHANLSIQEEHFETICRCTKCTFIQFHIIMPICFVLIVGHLMVMYRLSAGCTHTEMWISRFIRAAHLMQHPQREKKTTKSTNALFCNFRSNIIHNALFISSSTWNTFSRSNPPLHLLSQEDRVCVSDRAF